MTVVDAAAAYARLWVTYVEADHVVRALLECAASTGRGCLTKREVGAKSGFRV